MLPSLHPTARALRHAAVLLDAAARWGEPGLVARLEAGVSPGHLRWSVLQLPRDVHPLAVLDRLRLPAAHAVGLVVEGRSYVSGTAEPRGPHRLRCVHVVARHGAEVSATRAPGGRLIVGNGSAIAGRIPDALRRAAGAAPGREVRS